LHCARNAFYLFQVRPNFQLKTIVFLLKINYSLLFFVSGKMGADFCRKGQRPNVRRKQTSLTASGIAIMQVKDNDG